VAFDLKRLDEHTWNSFVSPRVRFKHSPNTRAIIKEVMPYSPKGCRCIAAFLNDADQFWKVNYHWKLLLHMLRRASALPLRNQSKEEIDTSPMTSTTASGQVGCRRAPKAPSPPTSRRTTRDPPPRPR
jgi:hypothetical protein